MTNEDMTIKEIYEMKKKFENALFKNVKQFEETTGVEIINICFNFENNEEGFPSGEAIGVEIETRLNNELYGNK